MREIKFRAWDEETGLITSNGDDNGNGYPISFIFNEDRLTAESWDDELHRLNPDGSGDEMYSGLVIHDMIFMQYTGLKDKNGVEIYEGDVLEFRLREHSVSRDLYSVEWIAPLFSAIWYSRGQRMPSPAITGGHLPTAHKRLKVIGNIYENPELLEETNNEH